MDSPLFRDAADFDMAGFADPPVGFTSGLGRARFALASAVVLRFLRGTLLVATILGLCPGVVLFLP